MKTAVVGAGGVGGYFGGRLAQHGHEVTFLARGPHLSALQSTGLQIISPQGDIHLSQINATDNAAEVGPVDAVIVAVKGWQLPDVISVVEPMLGENTAVLPLLNGIDAPRILATELAAKHVLGGLCGIVAYIDSPGVIRHVGIKPFVRLGEMDNHQSTRVSQLSAALVDAGVDCTVPDDIVLAMWKKFLFIAPVSAVTAISRATIGAVREQTETRELIEQAMHEIVQLASAQGVGLTESDVSATLSLMDGSPADGTTSLQRDIEAGKRSELHTQVGAVVRMAASSGIDVPLHDVFYRCLLPQERRANTG